EAQRRPVVAVALPGRPRPVVEHMPLVPQAAGAVILGARDAEAVVRLRPDIGGDDVVEARPAGAALVLPLRSEQRQRAAPADIGPAPVLVIERARPRPLGRLVAQHVIAGPRQPRPPLG